MAFTFNHFRIREGLTYFDHSSGPLQTELSLGKFTILPCRDPNGAAIALFNLSHHEPSEVTHQTVLQCVVFQLDVALEQVETQRNGLVFIYNMTNSKYSNFDYDLSQKMLTLLKGNYSSDGYQVVLSHRLSCLQCLPSHLIGQICSQTV